MRKPLTAEQLQKREERAFSTRIRSVFTNAGFVSLPVNGVHREFGDKTGELDHVFVYENVIIVAEDTVGKNLEKVRTHLKNKKILFDEIAKNRAQFLQWLRSSYADRLKDVDEYDAARYQIFYLYFSKYDIELTDADRRLFFPARIVSAGTLGYFQKMAQNIRKSSRTDIFRYLGLGSSDIGAPDSGGGSKQISTSIIYPTDNTGFSNGVRVVSFMMSADMLLRNSYVLRKDNWQDSIELYQRLIERDRIRKIRQFLASRKNTFINNIIVSLPDGVEFKNGSGALVNLDELANFDNVTLVIPDEMNTICVIDGQHRIYAHYEGADSLEKDIAKLRKKFHLLVTGLVYPSNMTDLERRKFESQLFLDINSNARPVPQDVLLFIETLKDPFSDLGVARQVLQRMNAKAPFVNAFQFSLTEDANKIKIASIIKFALRYLVDISEDAGKGSLFRTWSTPEDRAALLSDRISKRDTALLNLYLDYCASYLSSYFSAIRSVFHSDWADPLGKIRSTVSINGFVIALRRSLPVTGPLGYSDYANIFARLEQDFSSSGFQFTASQYAKFSRLILSQAFDMDSVDPEPALPEGEIQLAPEE